MQRLLHHELIQLTTQLHSLSVAWSKYQSKAYDTFDATLQLLDDSLSTYKNIGKTNREVQISALKAELVTAKRGIDPITYTKINTNKNELVMTICYKTLQGHTTLLEQDVHILTSTLRDAEELINQILVAALQIGLINHADIANITTMDQISTWWSTLGQNENIALGQDRVVLKTSKYDAILLFEQAIQSLKS